MKLDDGEICDIICSTFVYLKIPIIKRLFKKVNLLRKKKDILSPDTLWML